MVVDTCGLSYLGSQGRKITWTHEFKDQTTWQNPASKLTKQMKSTGKYIIASHDIQIYKFWPRAFIENDLLLGFYLSGREFA